MVLERTFYQDKREKGESLTFSIFCVDSWLQMNYILE